MPMELVNIDTAAPAGAAESSATAPTFSDAEKAIYDALSARPYEGLSRETLLFEVGYPEDAVDRSIDSHIKRLRKKLRAAHGTETIKTLYGRGYFYDPFPLNYRAITADSKSSCRLYEVIDPA